MSRTLSRVLLDDSFGRSLFFDGFWSWPTMPAKCPQNKVVKTRPNDKTTMLTIEVPGYEREKLSIVVEDGTLTINGERDNGASFQYQEYVGTNVITTAKLKNGLLTLTINSEKESKITIPIEE